MKDICPMPKGKKGKLPAIVIAVVTKKKKAKK